MAGAIVKGEEIFSKTSEHTMREKGRSSEITAGDAHVPTFCRINPIPEGVGFAAEMNTSSSVSDDHAWRLG